MSNGFLLDTNVLSELMRSQPAAPVLGWFAQNAQSAMHTSAVTQAEILSKLIIGHFAFEPQTNGNLSLIYNG